MVATVGTWMLVSLRERVSEFGLRVCVTARVTPGPTYPHLAYSRTNYVSTRMTESVTQAEAATREST